MKTEKQNDVWMKDSKGEIHYIVPESRYISKRHLEVYKDLLFEYYMSDCVKSLGDAPSTWQWRGFVQIEIETLNTILE